MQFVILFITFAFVDAQDSKPERRSMMSNAVQADVDADGDINIPADGSTKEASPKTKMVAKLAQKHATNQLAQAITMTLGLHDKMQPIRKRLMTDFNKAPTIEAKQGVQELMDHVDALDDYSKKMVMLVAGLQATQNRTQDEKEEAMLNLLHGMKSFSSGIETHLLALKDLSPEHREVKMLQSGLPKVHSGKIQKVLDIMEAEMQTELKDQRYLTDKNFRKHVQTDMLTYVLTKNAVEESDKIIAAAAQQFVKNPTEAVKTAVSSMVKDKLSVIKQKLSANLETLKTAVDIYAAKQETGEVPGYRETMATESAAAEPKSEEAEEPAKEPAAAEATETADERQATDVEPKDLAQAFKAIEDATNEVPKKLAQ